MKPIIAVIVFSIVTTLILSFCTNTESINKLGTPKPARELSVDNYPNLIDAAEKIAKATERKDAVTIVDLTYPKYVDMFGGREVVLNRIARGFEDYGDKGAQDMLLKPESAKEIFEIDNELFSLVPLIVTVKTSTGSAKGTDTMIAVSSNDGVTWNFITGMGQTDLEKLFPKVAEKIRIPEPTDL